jgi:hypothetical protein
MAIVARDYPTIHVFRVAGTGILGIWEIVQKQQK